MIVICSRNRGKVREILQVLRDLPVEVKTLADFPPVPEPAEDGRTFAENAAAKAASYCKSLGLPVVADDSGLAVDALGGRPGVRSARYAGEKAGDLENNRKLLAELAGVSSDKRTAHYECAVALALPGQTPVLFEARCDGIILQEPRGTGGFGYDPLFLDPELDRTFAEIPPELKNSRSHRGKALRKLREYMQEAARGRPLL